jgi:Dullard-like phosphatase family protein
MFQKLNDKFLSFYNNFILKNGILKHPGLIFFILFSIIITVKIILITTFTLLHILSPLLYIISKIAEIIIFISKIYNNNFIIGYFQLKKQKLKIFLDLDNTLIYSTFYKLPNINTILTYDKKYHIYKRPYLDTFLSTLSSFADIFVYTSSTQDYADKILKVIDKKGIIKKKYYRQNCINYQNRYFKDILKLNPSLSNSDDLIIIDDNPSIYLNMKENIIPIKFWEGEQNDDSLLKIKNIIKNYYNSGNENVKEFIKKTISYDI